MRKTELVLVVIAGFVGPSRALAQERADTVAAPAQAAAGPPVEVVQATAAPVVPAPSEQPIPRLDERTAFLVGARTLKLGLFAFDYGITDQVSIGVDPPELALRAFTKVLVPNLHTKLQLLALDPVWVSAQIAAYWANIQSSQVSGNLLDVPLSLYASVRIVPRFYVHLEGTYIFARLFGSGNVSSANIDGVAATRAIQAGLMLQLRLTRIFSVIATGRYQPYVADVAFNGSSQIDPLTTATVNGQIVPAVEHPWNVTGGVAVLWKHFHLVAGAGYGNYFVPGIDVADPKRTIVPDLSLAVLL
jgi:hypothetical protein